MRVQTAARIALPLYLGAIYATLGMARTLTEAIRATGHLRHAVLGAFTLSLLSAIGLVLRRPEYRHPRAVATLLCAAGVYAAALWPMESPEEKLHFLEYGLLALLADAAAPAEWRPRMRFVACVLFALAAGWGDEGIQALLPNRYYDLRDVGFNALAGVMALSVQALLRATGGRAPVPVAVPNLR